MNGRMREGVEYVKEGLLDRSTSESIGYCLRSPIKATVKKDRHWVYLSWSGIRGASARVTMACNTDHLENLRDILINYNETSSPLNAHRFETLEHARTAALIVSRELPGTQFEVCQLSAFHTFERRLARCSSWYKGERVES